MDLKVGTILAVGRYNQYKFKVVEKKKDGYIIQTLNKSLKDKPFFRSNEDIEQYKVIKENKMEKEQKLKSLIKEIVKEEMTSKKKLNESNVTYERETGLIYFKGIPFTLEDINYMEQIAIASFNIKHDAMKQFEYNLSILLSINDKVQGNKQNFNKVDILNIIKFSKKFKGKIASRTDFED